MADLATEAKKPENDLLVMASFDCFKPFPSSLVDYLDNTFKNEFVLSHIDIHKKRPDKEILPVLQRVDAECYKNRECDTNFEYDKQYGHRTTHDNIAKVRGVFYCCYFGPYRDDKGDPLNFFEPNPDPNKGDKQTDQFITTQPLRDYGNATHDVCNEARPLIMKSLVKHSVKPFLVVRAYSLCTSL